VDDLDKFLAASKATESEYDAVPATQPPRLPSVSPVAPTAKPTAAAKKTTTKQRRARDDSDENESSDGDDDDYAAKIKPPPQAKPAATLQMPVIGGSSKTRATAPASVTAPKPKAQAKPAFA